MTATFNGSNTTSVPVPTLSNEIAERIESFTAIVKVPANATRVSRMNGSDIATVQIKDDDGKFLLLIHVASYCCQTIHVHGCLAFNLRLFLHAELDVFFEPVSYNVTEGDNVSVSLVVTSTNYSFSFTVFLSYEDNTASNGVDYLSKVFSLDFSAEQSTATFEVPTIDDNIAELLESFTLVIVNTTIPTPVTRKDTVNASVHLIDNDGRQ